MIKILTLEMGNGQLNQEIVEPCANETNINLNHPVSILKMFYK